MAVGGGTGGALRYALSLQAPPGIGWPWATFAANVSGSFLLGVLMVGVLARPGVHRLLRPLLGVGLLGGWTTLSAYVLEAHQLVAAGRAGLAVAYLAATAVVAVAAVAAGAALARRVLGTAGGP